jgi:hypothetical protein
MALRFFVLRIEETATRNAKQKHSAVENRRKGMVLRFDSIAGADNHHSKLQTNKETLL